MRIRVLGEVNEKSWFFAICYKVVSYRINTIKYSEVWSGETNHNELKVGDNIYIPELEGYCNVTRVVKNIDGGLCLFTDYEISRTEDKDSYDQALNDQRKYEEKLPNDNKKEQSKYSKSQIDKILKIFI